jgi:hypothetical protein
MLQIRIQGQARCWILIAACWLVIRASRREPGTTWRELLLAASAWPAYATIAISVKSARH